MEKGCFVLRNEGDGCLTGKYMHDNNGPFTEACRIDDIKKLNEQDPFCNTFKTTWLEVGNKTQDLMLEINRQHDNPLLFELKWFSKKETSFWGKGMLHNGLLIGTYWDK